VGSEYDSENENGNENDQDDERFDLGLQDTVEKRQRPASQHDHRGHMATKMPRPSSRDQCHY
jgi:hypothetical protein